MKTWHWVALVAVGFFLLTRKKQEAGDFGVEVQIGEPTIESRLA